MKAGLWLAQHGFDVERLKFGGRTAFASCLALLVSWLIGLEHPQWSAMTVWAASQPMRGLLIEKSFFRAFGTVIGTCFGVLLTVWAGDDTLLLVVGLVLWVSLCAGAGNVLSGLLSYGTLLAGYSASMVALLNTTAHSDILALGLDRLLTVLLGVLVALLVGLLFNREQAGSDIASRTRRISAMVLNHIAAQLGHARATPAGDLDALLQEIAAIEETMDAHGAGSVRSRHFAHSLRAVLVAQVAGILCLKHPAWPRENNRAIADALSQAALALEACADSSEVLEPLKRAHMLSSHMPALWRVIGQIADALEQRYHFKATGTIDSDTRKKHFVLHRDWVYARQTMLRTSGVLLLVGLAWVFSGWKLGAYVMLGTSVMVSLFSTFENPAWIMRNVLIWQGVGATAALICRWLLWPHAGNELQLVLLMMPFVLIGVIPFAHRLTMWGSIDYIMIMLLLLQPHYPLTGTFAMSFAAALAVVAAPLVALIAFKLIFPADAGRRRQTLKAMMIHELQNLAADPDAPLKQHIWRIRLYHRVLKLVHWSGRTGENAAAVTHGSLAVLDIGSAILDMQQLLRDHKLDPKMARVIQATLRRMADLSAKPERVVLMLKRLERLLQNAHPPLGAQVQCAMTSLSSNLPFFRLAA